MSGRHLGVVSMLLFVPAWFLTAAHTSGELIGGPSAGWQAFLFAISPLFGNDMSQGLLRQSWMIASALSNVLLVCTLGLVVWRPAAVRRILTSALAATTVLNAVWFVLPAMRDDLRIGYFMWLTAFVVGTGAAWVTMRQHAQLLTVLVALASVSALTGCREAPVVPYDGSLGSTRFVDTVFTAATATTGIQYGASVPAGGTDAVPLLLDLYAPAGDTASARPVLVWIHGGGFVSGTRTDGQIPRLARSLALRGYVSVSISYRLRSPAAFNADQTGGIRDAVHDARAAVRWARANSAAYRLDPARIAFVGSSAGGVTALYGAYEEVWGEGTSGNPGYSSAVKVVVDFWGMLPDAADSVMQAGEPPLLIFHGTEDTTVPYVEAQQLVARAVAVNIPHRLVTLAGQGHAAWNNVPLFEAEMTPFLYQRLIP